MSSRSMKKVEALASECMRMPQLDLETAHVLHAGMYFRTIRMPAGSLITGALIRIPTVLIVSGDATFYTGRGVMRIAGYRVLEADAPRRQAIFAHTDTWLTMAFATEAKTVEEAEDEFTPEADRLLSRAAKRSKMKEV